MDKLPCIDCICLPICKPLYKRASSFYLDPVITLYSPFIELNDRCYLISKYIRIDRKKMNVARLKELQAYMEGNSDDKVPV